MENKWITQIGVKTEENLPSEISQKIWDWVTSYLTGLIISTERLLDNAPKNLNEKTSKIIREMQLRVRLLDSFEQQSKHINPKFNNNPELLWLTHRLKTLIRSFWLATLESWEEIFFLWEYQIIISQEIIYNTWNRKRKRRLVTFNWKKLLLHPNQVILLKNILLAEERWIYISHSKNKNEYHAYRKIFILLKELGNDSIYKILRRKILINKKWPVPWKKKILQ
jgi:hypothetical protein